MCSHRHPCKHKRILTSLYLHLPPPPLLLLPEPVDAAARRGSRTATTTTPPHNWCSDVITATSVGRCGPFLLLLVFHPTCHMFLTSHQNKSEFDINGKSQKPVRPDVSGVFAILALSLFDRWEHKIFFCCFWYALGFATPSLLWWCYARLVHRWCNSWGGVLCSFSNLLPTFCVCLHACVLFFLLCGSAHCFFFVCLVSVCVCWDLLVARQSTWRSTWCVCVCGAGISLLSPSLLSALSHSCFV